MTNLRKLLLTVAALAILPGATHAASVSITFDFPILSAQPGETVTFRGTITNLESVNVDLNSCGLTLGGQFTTDNCALFFAGPLFLLPNETSDPFDMFTVTVNLPYTDPFGLQPPGTFTVLGGLEINSVYDGNTQNILGEAPLEMNVVPEPGTAALLCLALPLACAVKR